MAGLAGLGEVWLGKAGLKQKSETTEGEKMKGLDYIGWITASSIEDARHYSGLCDNVKVLKSALKCEREFKNRKTVIRMLEVRIRKIEKEKKHV